MYTFKCPVCRAICYCSTEECPVCANRDREIQRRNDEERAKSMRKFQFNNP